MFLFQNAKPYTVFSDTLVIFIFLKWLEEKETKSHKQAETPECFPVVGRGASSAMSSAAENEWEGGDAGTVRRRENS